MRLRSKRVLPLALCLGLWAHAAYAQVYDLVVSGGRLIDPRHAIDDIRHIGIKHGRVASVSSEPLQGIEHIDATGLVITPGFIDLHSHALSLEAQHYQAFDGVTTALELEAGIFPIDTLHARFSSTPLLHTGASSSHLAVRQLVLGNAEQPHFTDPVRPAHPNSSMQSSAGFTARANDQQITEMLNLHGTSLDRGAIGIGLPLDYMSQGVTEKELSALFRLAASRDAPVFVHMRRGLPGDLDGLNEMIRHARDSGAWVHICHLQSMVMNSTEMAVEIIGAAAASGVKISAEAYPYNAGSTVIGAAVFGRDWQRIFGIGYSDVQWVTTGERLTAETFAAYRQEQPGGAVVHHYGDEADTRYVMASPDIIIASDAMPLPEGGGFVHPRGIGTFTRFLSHYVDEWDAEGPLTALQAIAKITDLPSKILSYAGGMLSSKGHLGVGADADITIFDPVSLSDQATYLAPLKRSTGVRWLLVCGKPVISNGEFNMSMNEQGPAEQLPTRCGN